MAGTRTARSAGGPSRVLLIAGGLDPRLDGVADYTLRLAGALQEAGARVRVLHLGAPSAVAGTRSAGGRWHPLALLRARRASRGADVVHVQFAPSAFGFRAGIGLLPAAVRGRPLVTTLHEYGWWRALPPVPRVLWRRLERRAAADRESLLLVPRSAAVVTTNAEHGAVLARRFAGRIGSARIPIGANVGVEGSLGRADARAALRRRLGAAPTAVVLAFFGFVHPVKGIRYLAEAVAMLTAEGRDVHAVVIGGFESLALPAHEAAAFERELRALIEAAGAADRVHVTGFLPAGEASDLLAGADVGVLPFTHGVTAKSGSLLTVLAHGLPTAVTLAEDGDAGEVAEGDRVVVIERRRDGAAIAAAVARLLDDPALAARVTEQGRAWAATRDWRSVAARHLEVYREVIGG